MTDRPNTIAVLTAVVDGTLDLPHPVGIAHDFDSAAVLTGQALQDIIAKRIGQIERHGYTISHDLEHAPQDLALAGAAYVNTAIDALHGKYHPATEVPEEWPFMANWNPSSSTRENLIKGIALLWATVDGMDHAARDSGEHLLAPIAEADLPY